jgi:hypothetical protein
MGPLKKKKPVRERKWTGTIKLSADKEESKRRMELANRRSMKEMGEFYKRDPEGFRMWIEGIKMRTEEMAHEEIKPYRRVKTERFSKMSTPELKAKLAESEARLKRLDKDEFLYDRHFAIFAEEDMLIINRILAERKKMR